MTILIAITVIVLYLFLDKSRKKKEENDIIYRRENIRRIREMNKTEKN